MTDITINAFGNLKNMLGLQTSTTFNASTPLTQNVYTIQFIKLVSDDLSACV